MHGTLRFFLQPAKEGNVFAGLCHFVQGEVENSGTSSLQGVGISGGMGMSRGRGWNPPPHTWDLAWGLGGRGWDMVGKQTVRILLERFLFIKECIYLIYISNF